MFPRHTAFLQRKNCARGSADFDNDGYADLAVGVPGKIVDEQDGAGAVNVLYGGPGGLTAAGAQIWSQESPGVIGFPEAQDNFGASLAWGDIDGNGFDDLVIGAPDENYGDIDDGVFHVLYGSAAGLTSNGDQVFGQRNTGELSNQFGDRFGASIAVGDFNGDGFDDVGAGAPGQDLTSADNGIIAIVYSSGSGLTGSGNAAFRLNHFGLFLGLRDEFGHTLSAGDFNGDGECDLAIGAPYRTHHGSLWLALSSWRTDRPAESLPLAPVVEENSGAGADAGDALGFALATETSTAMASQTLQLASQHRLPPVITERAWC